MVSRCANPSCQTQFKYLHEGRLFQFASSGTQIGIHKNHLNFVFWWLCPRCCSSMTLVQHGSAGVRLVALPDLRKICRANIQSEKELPLE